ncbi:MAG: acyltransferase [Isosphaeraceae bacterium]
MAETAAPESPSAAAESSPATPRLYLPELDGLRFIAFALVFLFHQGFEWIELAKLVGSDATHCFRQNGWVGVQLFFILSGYLITTLLLREESLYCRVDLRAFWVRRILRIWPLFYLVVLIAFVLMPAVNGDLSYSSGRATHLGNLPWFLAFLGNWRMVTNGPVPYDAQSVLWSVCVEEQFYLLVPLIVAFLPSRARIPAVVVLIAASVGWRGMLAGRKVNQLAIQYNTFAQFDTLASGVLLALCLGSDPRTSRAGRWVRWLRWPGYLFAVWVFRRNELGHGDAWNRTWDFVLIWAAGLVLVADAVTVDGWLRDLLSQPRLVWLGKISYGLYMYHEVMFWLRDFFRRWMGWFPFEGMLLPLGTLALTIAVSAISYNHFESRFLRLKRGWTRVPSRPE